MSTKTMILFPYGGYVADSKCEDLFWKLVDTCRAIDEEPIDEKPLVVLNRDTETQGNAAAFLDDSRKEKVEILKVWSVDSCQMWLTGWGYIIDRYPESSRIVQLPGDIETIKDETDFFNDIHNFITASGDNFVIGDFNTGDRYSAKELIDTYGIYPLLANWFPKVFKKIRGFHLRRPRSEFLNIKTTTLKEFLKYQKFAYEQTLNMIIHAWDFEKDTWQANIKRPRIVRLGTIKDDSTFRQYGGCLNQIERTERLLKYLWREIHEPRITGDDKKDEQEYKKFSDEYDDLDRRSTAIREGARIAIRALLGT